MLRGAFERLELHEAKVSRVSSEGAEGQQWPFATRPYAPKSRYLLDHHHLCEKLKERIFPLYKDKKRRKEVMDTILDYLNADNVDDALEYIHGLRKRFRKRYKRKHLQKLADYIERNREGIWYKEAREKGIPIGSGSVDKAGDILICPRVRGDL